MRKTGKSVVGLDIGHQVIKAVLASANGQHLRVQRVDEIPLPLDLNETGAALRRWWDEQHLGHTPVVTSIGGSRVLYQHLRMEKEDPRSHQQVAQMEAVRFSEMTDANMEVSVSPASGSKQERSLLLSMARPDLLEQALNSPQKANLNLINACPAPVALYNGFVSLGEPVHQPTLFANLGAAHTEMVIGNGQGVLFARSFAMGTAQLTQSLATKTRTSFAQAERIRLQTDSAAECSDELREVTAAFVKQWSQELNACLQIYQESAGKHPGAEPIRRLMLCGGGARWTPLVEGLKRELTLSLSTPGSLPGLENENSLPYITACGLAADGLGLARAPSSLLTSQIRQSLDRRRNKRYWMVTSVFSVAALAMFGAATQLSFQREKDQLNQHNQTLQRSDTIRLESEKLLERKAQVDRMMRPLVDFVYNSTRIRDLTLLIADKKAENDFITFLGDSDSYLRIRLEQLDSRERRARQPPPGRNPANRLRTPEVEETPSPRMNRLIVEGFTPDQDLSTVKALIENLQADPAIEKADLLSDDLVVEDQERDTLWQSSGHRRFVLDLRLVPAALSSPREAP
ncbi:MAG: pilus assembly protein PilM [Kiritimatiellia bacterium]